MPVALFGTLLRSSWTCQSSRSYGLALGVVLVGHYVLLGGFMQDRWPSPAHDAGDALPSMHLRMLAPAPGPVAPPSGIVGGATASRPAAVLPDRVADTTSTRPELEPETQAQDPVAPPPNPGIESASTAETSPPLALPPPMVLSYAVSGQAQGQDTELGATLAWKHDGEVYQASLTVGKLRQWTSKGTLTTAGLAPLRFGEKAFRRAEVASHFVRDEGRVVFSVNAAPAPLLAGAQDYVSVFIQLASLWAGDPSRLVVGKRLDIQTIGPRQAQKWVFVVLPDERINVPGGSMQAIKLLHEATGDYSPQVEIWLAPQLAYLPARIRFSEPGANVMDLLWTGRQEPTSP